MPAVIPIIAAFASGAVGAVVAGTASFAAYATVAGAVMSTVGALSGNKSLSKIGMVLSLGAGIANLASAAGSAGSAASTGIDTATQAGDYVNAMDAASDAATAAGSAGSVGTVAGVADAASSASSMASDASGLANTTGLPDVTTAGANAGAAAAPVDAGLGLNSGMPSAGGGSLMDAANNGLQQQSGAGLIGAGTEQVASSADKSALFGSAGYGQSASPAELAQGSALTEAGKALSWQDIQSFYDKAAKAVGGVGEWANKNPVLSQAALSAVGNMYGPQAERLDLEKSLMERARANLNAPVKLNFNKGG